MPVIGVLALQGDVREHLRALGEAGAEAVPVRRLAEIEAVDGLVIPGGESTTLWRLTVAFELLDPLRKLIAAGLPAFGSCAGMIMLADRLVDGVGGQQTLGGIDMTVRRNAFGRQIDSFERAVTLFIPGGQPPGDPPAGGDSPSPLPPLGQVPHKPRDLPSADSSPFHAVFIRAPWVERAGPGVTVLGTDGGGPRQGRIIAVRQGGLLATAFHPELTPDRRIHELFVSMVKGTS